MAAYAASLALLVAGCEQQENTYVAPPPPEVGVVLPVQRQVTRYLEATGTTAAVKSAQLVARVSGFLRGIHYRDGALVRQGSILFTIEPEPHRLKLEQARALGAAAQAALKQASADYERQLELNTRQVASKAALENATANRDSAQAKLKQTQVDTQQAALNLSYTEVKAPFDGIVLAHQVSVGELVGVTGPTTLATIIDIDWIYVNFNVSEQVVLRFYELIRQRGLTLDELRKVAVEVGLQNESGYPHQGTLDYAAPMVTQGTGTLTVRAILPNPGRIILPGYFVRIRIPLDPQNAFLVPDAAVGSDHSGRYLLVVGPDNIVEQRKVEIGPKSADLRVIDSGLTAEDRVVTRGRVRAIPGQKVIPQLLNPTVGSTSKS
jgi:RND family efflux transporter MFP subunit